MSPKWAIPPTFQSSTSSIPHDSDIRGELEVRYALPAVDAAVIEGCNGYTGSPGCNPASERKAITAGYHRPPEKEIPSADNAYGITCTFLTNPKQGNEKHPLRWDGSADDMVGKWKFPDGLSRLYL